MSAAVLVSTSRHPLSGLPCPSRNDVLALEIGRRLAGAALRVLHSGDPADPALADYLAFGAPVIEVAPSASQDDLVPALAEQLCDVQLILCGCRAEGGGASGMLPYLLATALDRPVITDALDVKLGEGVAHVLQFLPRGRRRRIDVPLPAIIAIHRMAAAEPRYAYARRLAGRITSLQASQPIVSQPRDDDATAWRLEDSERAPVKLKAADRRTGHARMLSATGSTQRGGQVVIEGSSVEKAQLVLAYLREHDLIDF